MTPAHVAMMLVAAVGLFNAAFFSVVAYELSGHSMAIGAAGALVILIAESILVKVMGPKIAAKINDAMAPQGR